MCSKDFTLALCLLLAFGDKKERYVFTETKMVSSDIGKHRINKKSVLNKVIYFKEKKQNKTAVNLDSLPYNAIKQLHPQTSSLIIMKL